MDLRSKTRTSAFIVVSVLAHIALAAGVMLYKFRTETRKTQISTVEINDSGADASTAPVQSEVEKPAEAPQLADTFKAPPPAKAAPELPGKAVKAAPAAPVETAVAIPVAPATPAEDSTPSAPSETSVSEETPTQEESPVIANLKEEEISETLDKVDEEVEAKVSEAQEKISEESEQALKEHEAKLEALKQQQAEEDAARAAAAEERKRENERQALAAVAAERMAREAQAAREAEQARLAEAARIAEETRLKEARSKAETLNSGAGGNGVSTGGVQSGSSSGENIRSLSELKPMPGNRRPVYDVEHRRRGLQGEVAFLAYVSKEGLLTEFKMLQSSGHRELDAKTLKSIKSWRFYPGQEGWVEIPFKWDLSGEPQEMPATLRRRAQVSETQ